MVVAKLSCINRGYFWICLFQYMVLAKYPCIETRWCSFFDAPFTPHPGVEPRIWYHIRAQKHGDVPSFYTPVTPYPGVEPRIWYHIRAQKHGDVSLFYVPVTPHPGMEARIWHHIRVQKHGNVPFFYTPVTPHPGVEPRIWYHIRLYNIRGFYTQILSRPVIRNTQMPKK